jgi:hypothetical protein
MTESDLATLVRTIGPVIRDYVAKAVGDLVARVTAVEVKAGAAVDLRDRLVALETKSGMPAPADPSIASLRDRVLALELKAGAIEDRALSDPTKEIATLRERLAVLEVKAAIPGPPGKDGADGMGWDDLLVEHDGERTFTIKVAKGERVKAIGTFTLPVQIYRGIWADGKSYEPGDTVTHARHLWYCRTATALKPDAASIDMATGRPTGPQGRDAWKMCVRGGTDGRDGKDGRDLTAPVRLEAGR